MNMVKQTTDQIVIKMLEDKNAMEKAHDFVSSTMRKVRSKDPVAKIRVMQLQQEIEILKVSKGEARKSAAGRLARSLAVHRKSMPRTLPCNKCGAQLTSDVTFCADCGAKVGTNP
jgi:hypothetical protein